MFELGRIGKLLELASKTPEGESLISEAVNSIKRIGPVDALKDEFIGNPGTLCVYNK